MGSQKIIECQFNLFREGRTYSGHHRNYILESAIKTCYAPAVRERINLREALGYFGHGRREISGRLNLPEVTTVKLPDGSSMIVENVPSNVTVAFEVMKDGTVNHSQQILETEPAKIVSALNASKVGGFSWACGGVNGGAMGGTKVNDFHGFDYVMNPGFADNRGYILESAGSGMILESVARATSLPDTVVEKYLRHWTACAVLENAELQEQLLTASIAEDSLREELEHKGALLESAQKQLQELEQKRERAQQLILEAASKTHIAVPERVLHAMLNMSTGAEFETVTAFFESAKQVKLTHLPMGAGQQQRVPQTHQPKGGSFAPGRREVQYGEAAAAPDFESQYI